MKYYSKWIVLVILGVTCALMSCAPAEYHPIEPIYVDGLTPLGIAKDGSNLWISDSDHNHVVKIDQEGKVLTELEGFERPMHIDFVGERLYIPSYGLDAILVTDGKGKIDSMGQDLELDAPAGISKQGDRIAIADFYNHRILYYDGSTWQSFGGEKGHEPGQFDYPTDVQLLDDRIYVADAYNNRGQIIGLDGSSILVFGEDQEMNAATGIFATKDRIALTDFENDRVLVFDLEGKVIQVIEGSLLKPTDVLIDGDIMYVTNYKGGFISRFIFE